MFPVEAEGVVGGKLGLLVLVLPESAPPQAFSKRQHINKINTLFFIIDGPFKHLFLIFHDFTKLR
jgi:hypothetical protein